jgi:hypothetical protein
MGIWKYNGVGWTIMGLELEASFQEYGGYKALDIVC